MAAKPAKTFGLWAAVSSWHDGDTCYGVVDQGFGVYRGGGLRVIADPADPVGPPLIVIDPIRLRAALIQAPELSTGSPGLVATRTAGELAPPAIYPATSYKPDEFGRPLVDLILPDGRLFSAAMLEAGQAVRYRR